MRRPSPPLVLLGSGALALVSLYLPWQSAPNGVDGSFGLLSTVGPQHVDGWSTVGNLLALAALLVIALAGLALVQPLLDKQLPLGQAALALAFLTAAVLAETRHDAQQHAPTLDATFHTAYGTYVGLAAALVALGAAAVHRRDDLEDLRYDPRAWPSPACGLVLLVALLLPWMSGDISGPESVHVETLGIATAPGAIAALLAVRVLAVRTGTLALAAVLLLFTAGAFVLDDPLTRRYGAWIGLAAAAGALAVALPERRSVSLRRVASVPGVALAVMAASLFTPWQRACFPKGDLAEYGVSSDCLTRDGWADTRGLALATGMLLAICLAAVVLALVVRAPARIELTAALALLVATAGFRLETRTLDGVDYDIGYGALVGFVAVAALVVVGLTGTRATELIRPTGWTTAAGAALGAVYAAAVVLPWWGLSALESWTTLENGLARLSWLTIAAALMAVRLTGRWIARASGSPDAGDELVVLPLALGALVVLDVARYGLDAVTWNTAVLGGLAAGLAVLGTVERVGGFEHVHVPDLLRVDRL